MRSKRHLLLFEILALALFQSFTTTRAAETTPFYFSTGKVFIVSSSHQDTGWMDTPATCRNFRIEHNILPALAMMRQHADYTFCMEGTLHLMEFLTVHPELRGEVIQRMKEGRLEFGATYNEPYESWLSGEELIRETYFGRRWILKNLPGCDTKVAFNPDPPGRSLQMQQILAKGGIPDMFISRFHEGLWRWQSPDGSSVLTYSPGHYGNHLAYLNGAPADCVRAIHGKLDEQAPIYQLHDIPPVYCLVNSMDFSRPVDFDPLINLWNRQTAAQTGEGLPPVMSYSSIRGFFAAIDKPEARFNTLLGERPDVWVYITGPTHAELASAKREAARLLPAAETFTTIACLLGGSFTNWPANEFSQAWLDEIYIDHGIGGKDGHITDEVFFSKIRNARDTGRALLDQALGSIASRVKTDARRGLPITIFNDLSWSRSDVVEMDLPANFTGLVQVVDADGKEIPSQETRADSPDEINVAAAAMGATATADSVFNSDYVPEKAIDNRWNVRDPNPETGGSSKWNSGAGAGPHWLTIDFGRPRAIHKVVICHEGVLGVFGGETKYNTTDFQIQSADSAAGPWTDLVVPVTNNTASLTVHRFAPKTFRFLRLYITKGAQDDSYARIYEVQAFEKWPPKSKLMIVASNVPPLGYKTYYLVNTAAKKTPTATVGTGGCENNFYRITLAPGGIKSLFDKQQNRELLKPDRFLGGEVFTLLSVAPTNRGAGTDAGEFGAVPLPVMDETFDRVANHRPEWKLIESGPVRLVYQLEQPLADTTVRQRLVVWNAIKRLDCEVDLQDFNGKLWREFRMALPLAADQPQINYEVPFGVVQIGRDEIPMNGGHAYGGLNYSQQCRDIHPREVQDFVDASDSLGGLTMSSSVSVFDWIDPTTNAPSGTLLQPVLLASRKSCNGEGNWYPQAGDHHFRFALTTHAGGWRNGWRDGLAANHPLQAVIGATPRSDASLPEAKSFFTTSETNVIISTIKKCEDDDSVIVRLYDLEGRDTEPTLTSFLPMREAKHTDIIEEAGTNFDTSGGDVRLPVGHNAIETLKLDLQTAELK
jgi:alpha-mannosidase